MFVGYMRVSKDDGSQVHDLQFDALREAGVKQAHIYDDKVSGAKDALPGLESCIKSTREGDTLVIWKLDRLGRSLRHLINLAYDLNKRGVGLKVLTGQGAMIDTTTPAGRLGYAMFAAFAEYEREQMLERTNAGIAAARARGRRGGRKPKMTAAMVRLAQAAMGKRETKVSALCEELGITRQTLYRHVGPSGALRPDGERLIASKARRVA